jgi:hypothetical protein
MRFLLKNEVINLAPKFVIKVVFNKDTIASKCTIVPWPL